MKLNITLTALFLLALVGAFANWHYAPLVNFTNGDVHTIKFSNPNDYSRIWDPNRFEGTLKVVNLDEYQNYEFGDYCWVSTLRMSAEVVRTLGGEVLMEVRHAGYLRKYPDQACPEGIHFMMSKRGLDVVVGQYKDMMERISKPISSEVLAARAAETKAEKERLRKMLE